MASQIPAFVTAMQDPRLRGNAREVYVWFHEHLDVIEYRPVKHSVLEIELGMADRSIGKAIGRLIDRGYVHRVIRPDMVRTYRLIYSVQMPTATLPTK